MLMYALMRDQTRALLDMCWFLDGFGKHFRLQGCSLQCDEQIYLGVILAQFDDNDHLKLVLGSLVDRFWIVLGNEFRLTGC